VDIADLIRQAVARGCRGITLWPNSGGWQANVTYDGQGYKFAVDRDALAALTTVLTEREAAAAPAAEVDLFG